MTIIRPRSSTTTGARDWSTQLSTTEHCTDCLPLGRLQEYEVIGRHLPTEANPTPAMYRMTIFAPNETVAKSRYWYFLRGLRKVKKATGEIVSVKAVCSELLEASELPN